jgi:peptidoglycan/LPS O-acetylase OafA/YrhL
MNRPFSVYLDLVRFAAAVLVYMWHSNQRFLTTEILPVSNYGHSAVIVFFVLSGFVIAFITETKENRLADFAASRISRVYSVAAPALVITVALDAIGRTLYPAIYQYPFDQFAVRLLASLLMLNEIWFISITSFSNVPYWSICFEWWYYVTFAMVMFLPARIGWILVIVTALLIGPKVVLLAPIWWMGVLLYRWRHLRDLSLSFAWTLAAISVVGLVLFHRHDLMAVAEGWLEAIVGPDMTHQLTFAKRVFADYLLGVLVFVNFAAVRRIVEAHGNILMAIAGPVRFFANYTFSLYLLHQPLFLFWAAVVRGDPATSGYWWSVTTLTMLSVGIIGFFTETRRHGLRALMLPLLVRCEKAWAVPVRATGPG